MVLSVFGHKILLHGRWQPLSRSKLIVENITPNASKILVGVCMVCYAYTFFSAIQVCSFSRSCEMILCDTRYIKRKAANACTLHSKHGTTHHTVENHINYNFFYAGFAREHALHAMMLLSSN